MKYEYDLGEPSFKVANIDIQSVSRPKGYKHSFKNGRQKHGFIYTVKGAMCDVFSNGKELRAEEGELVFIPKGSIYTGIYSEDGTEIKIVQFDISVGELPEYLSEPTKIELPSVAELFEDFFSPSEHRRTTHPFYYLSKLYNLLWQIDESKFDLPGKYRKLRPALTEIAEHSAENLPVSYYSSLCDMSEGNFRRLFREYTGTSPIEYRNHLRLGDARRKLQSGEYNVSEVAELCGFTNLSFFIRLYKKKYGYTPKKE